MKIPNAVRATLGVCHKGNTVNTVRMISVIITNKKWTWKKRMMKLVKLLLLYWTVCVKSE